MRSDADAGGLRREGIPELLPGLNFIAGLAGETARTYALNREFLEKVLQKGYLIRRVNIRQLMPFEGTRARDHNALPVQERLFRDFKEWTRRHFDLPMLCKVFPTYTISVRSYRRGRRGILPADGSYPILRDTTHYWRGQCWMYLS